MDPDKFSCPDILDHDFFVILFQGEIALDIHWKLKLVSLVTISEQWAASSTWSKMNGLERTDVQITLFE